MPKPHRIEPLPEEVYREPGAWFKTGFFFAPFASLAVQGALLALAQRFGLSVAPLGYILLYLVSQQVIGLITAVVIAWRTRPQTWGDRPNIWGIAAQWFAIGELPVLALIGYLTWLLPAIVDANW